MELLRSKYQTLPLFLTDASGTPLTGVTPADIIISIRKKSASPYTKTLVLSDNFFEVDATGSPGLYEMTLTPMDTNVRGTMSILIRENAASGVKAQLLTPEVTQSFQTIYVTGLAQQANTWIIPVPRRGDSILPAYLSEDIFRLDAITPTGVELGANLTWSETSIEGVVEVALTELLPEGVTTFKGERGDLNVPLFDGFATYSDGTEGLGQGFSANLYDVFFENENVGWAIIREATSKILYTTDGGGYWQEITDPAVSGASNLNAIDGAYDAVDDAFHVFTAGDGPDVYWWDGSTWSVLTSDATATGRCLGIHARTSDDVWFVGATIAGDFDGRFISRWNGAAMSLVTLPGDTDEDATLNGDALYSVYSTALDVVHVCGGGRYARSINGGTTWNDTVISSFPVGLNRSLHFWDSNNGIVLGTSGYVRTTNGGSNWSSATSFPDSSTSGRRVKMINGQNWIITNANSVWAVQSGDWVRVSARASQGISFVDPKIRVAAFSYLLDNVADEIVGDPLPFELIASIEASSQSTLTSISADTQALQPLLLRNPISGIIVQGATYDFTVPLEDTNKVPVLGVDTEGVVPTYHLNGVLNASTLDVNEIGSGLYRMTVPTGATVAQGDLTLRIEPAPGSDQNWNFITIEDIVANDEYYFYGITTWVDETTNYGFVVGSNLVISTFDEFPVAYVSTDLETWVEDTGFTSIASLSYDYTARSLKVGADIVTAVLDRDNEVLFVKVGAGAWASYAMPGTFSGNPRAMAIEDSDRIWIATSTGEVALWDGTTISEINQYDSNLPFESAIMVGTDLWLVSSVNLGVSALVIYNTVGDSFSNESSRLGSFANDNLYYISGINDGQVLIVGDGIWLSTDSGATFVKQTLPTSATDIYGSSINPSTQEYYSAGFSQTGVPLVSNDALNLHFDGTDWVISTISFDAPIGETAFTEISPHGYASVEYTQSVITTAVWLPPTVEFAPQFFRFTVVPETLDPLLAEFETIRGAGFTSANTLEAISTDISSISVDLTPVTTSLNEIKGAGFVEGTDSLEAIRDALSSVDVDLTPVTTALDEIKGVGFDTAEDSLVNAKGRLEGLTEAVARNLGLSQENIRITDQEYDGSGNLIGSVIKIYPTAVDVAAETNEIAEYQLTASYDINNRLVDYQFVRV